MKSRRNKDERFEVVPRYDSQDYGPYLLFVFKNGTTEINIFNLQELREIRRWADAVIHRHTQPRGR